MTLPVNSGESPVEDQGDERLIAQLEGVDQDYIPLDAVQIDSERINRLPLYIFYPIRKRMVLFKQAGEAVSRSQLDELMRGGCRTLYVPREYLNQTHEYITEKLFDVVADPSLSSDDKSRQFHSLADKVMKNLFEASADPETFVSTAKLVSDSLAHLIISEPDSVFLLSRLRAYDYATYSHSLNVCVLGVGLYRRLNPYTSDETVKDLTRGMLLHDIGKCDVPSELTNKRGPLSLEEWGIMQNHTVKGYERLAIDKQLSEDARTVALLHHEAMDGSGYPFGRTGDAIPYTSRICKVVDVYDALTSRRSYKDALPPYETLRLMINEMKEKMDQNILREFVIFMETMGKRNVRRAQD